MTVENESAAAPLEAVAQDAQRKPPVADSDADAGSTARAAPAGTSSEAPPRFVAGALAASIIGGAALGLVQALASSQVRAHPGSAAISVALAAGAGLCTGLPLWAAVGLARRIPPVRRLLLRARDVLNGRGDRETVVAAHAWALTSLLWGAGASALVAVVLRRLWLLPEADLALALALALIAVMLITGSVIVPVAAKLLSNLLRRLDRSLPLPWPRQAELRYLIAVVPAGALLTWFTGRYGEFVALLRSITPLAMLLAATGLVALLSARLALRTRAQKLLGPLVAVAALLAIVGGGAAYPRQRDPAIAELPPTAALGGRILRAVTDVDFDGSSSVLGGGDCAPLDARRNPRAEEIPGNDTDENCDGEAAKAERPGGHSEPLFSGALTPAQRRKYNIVWIVMDAVRADRTTLLGYAKPTTPALARLGQVSVVFTHAQAPTSTTGFSFPSMLIGKSPGNITWERNGIFVRSTSSETNIAQRLKTAGYRTGIVITKYTREMFEGAIEGFDTVATVEPPKTAPGGWQNRRAPYVNQRAIDFITEMTPAPANPPFFVVLHFPDAHHPYTAHPEIAPGFDDSPSGAYDSEIAFTDRYVGQLLDYLNASPVLANNTILIVTSDHGEEFNEHGGTVHARTCYSESISVPLVLSVPGFKPQRVDKPVSLIDLVPTLLELTGTPPGDAPLEGQSLLVPMLRPEQASPDRPLFCAIASLNKATLGDFVRYGVYQSGYALLQDVYTSRFELYALQSDPGQTKNLVGEPQEQSRIAAMKSLLPEARTGNLKPPWRF